LTEWVKLAEWARSFVVHPQTAYRWFREDRMPVAARCLGEVGSGVDGQRPELARLLRDTEVGARVNVEEVPV
jgi:predicted site-specific integrase-resolvase